MTNELEEKIKKRKERRRRRRLFSFLGFILLLIYIPAIWNWAFSNNHEIGAIKTATLEITVPIQGMLVRDEVLLKSPGDGIIIPSLQYGERAAKGSVVASYIQTDTKEVVENYRQMEIEILKRVVAEFDSSSGSEREFWESAIETQMAKLSDLSNAGDLSSATSIRTAVDRVLESKARYMLESSDLKNSLKSEKNELERLRSSIEKSITNISSSVSGIVSYNCDGFEEACTSKNRSDITKKQVSDALAGKSPSDTWVSPAEISAKKDDVIGKIVSNYEGWITFFVPEKEGKEISVLFEKAKLDGKQLSYELELNGVSDRIPVTLEKVYDPEDGFRKITAVMTQYIERTMNFRAVSGNLLLQNVTGMKVPLRSLINENSVDHTADIAIVEMNKATFKRVQIIGRDESYAIIDNIDPTKADDNVNIFDIYLVNPKNVVEGQVVEK